MKSILEVLIGACCFLIFLSMLLQIRFNQGLMEAIQIDPAEMARALGNYEGGVASGTARQKKKADELLGHAMLESYPIVSMLSNRFPQLADYATRYPAMVPYLATQLTSIVGNLGGNLPPELQGLIDGLLGSQLGGQQKAPQRSRPRTGFD